MDFVTAKLSCKLLNMLLYYVVSYLILYYILTAKSQSHYDIFWNARFHAFADDAKNNILQNYVETCTMLNC